MAQLTPTTADCVVLTDWIIGSNLGVRSLLLVFYWRGRREMLQVKQGAVVHTWADEVWNWKNWFPLGLILLIMLLFEESICDVFGYGVVDFLEETFLTAAVFMLGFILAVVIAGSGLRSLLGAWKPALILPAIIWSPLTAFEVYAHYEMSHALAPVKLNFAHRAEGGSRVSAGSALKYEDLLLERDALLRDYCYIRLGGWREKDGQADLTAVYVFTACLEK